MQKQIKTHRNTLTFIIPVRKFGYGILKAIDDQFMLFDSHRHYYWYGNESLFNTARIFVHGSKPDLIIFIVAKLGVVICSIAALEVTKVIQALPTKPIMVVQKQITKEYGEKKQRDTGETPWK